MKQRRAYVDAYEFGLTLKAARDHARAGYCKLAKSSFKEATLIGFNLVYALPNMRGEVERKIAMVENTLLEHGCKARHFASAKRAR